MSLEEAGEGSIWSTPVVIPFPLEQDLDVKSDEPEEVDELTEDENNVQVVLPSMPPPARSMVTIVIKAAEAADTKACSGM